MIISALTMIHSEEKRLHEWIDFHSRVHNIDRFVFYLDNPKDNSKGLLDSLKGKYNIEYFYTHQDNPFMGRENEFACGRQTDALTRGSIYLKDISDWIAIFDVDEFIVPNEDKRLKDVLNNIEHNRLYIYRWYFKPPFNLNRPMKEQCFDRWSEEERTRTGHGSSGKSIFKTSAYKNTPINVHYGPYPENNIQEIISSDFKIHHFQSHLTHLDKKYEVFDDSILRYFKNE